MLEEVVRLLVSRNDIVIRYDGYLINEYKFHIKGREINRKTEQ